MSTDVKRCIDKSPAQAAGIIRREVECIVCAVETLKSCFHLAADMGCHSLRVALAEGRAFDTGC